MKKLINLISEEVTKAFVSAGYDEKYGKVTLSNRPDLCEFQCNGAMAAAKEYKCAPFMISDKVAALLESDEMFESVESVKPGFLNIKMDTAFLAKYMNDMKDDEGRYGLEKAKKATHYSSGLRRTKRRKASSCRTPSFGSNRRER